MFLAIKTSSRSPPRLLRSGRASEPTPEQQAVKAVVSKVSLLRSFHLDPDAVNVFA
jgi:hypothetical protein